MAPMRSFGIEISKTSTADRSDLHFTSVTMCLIRSSAYSMNPRNGAGPPMGILNRSFRNLPASGEWGSKYDWCRRRRLRILGAKPGAKLRGDGRCEDDDVLRFRSAAFNCRSKTVPRNDLYHGLR